MDGSVACGTTSFGGGLSGGLGLVARDLLINWKN